MSDNIVVQIDRSAIEAGDIGVCRGLIEDVLFETPATARGYFQSVIFWFPGYDGDPREVVQIPEARAWFQKMDEAFPFFIYWVMPEQYYLYIASQERAAGTGLTVHGLIQFITSHEKAIRNLCLEIGDEFERVSTKIGVEMRQMLKPQA